ncbi:MAG: MFS transporter [Alphaproteobacteria bacterium]
MTSLYYGWIVVALTFVANLTATSIRSAPSVLIHPLEAEFGWSRTAISLAASLNLLLLGLFAPVGGWLIDRVGPRRVILGTLAATAVGVAATIFIRELWQLVFLWGVILGVASAVTPSLGPSVASRWFVRRRGLALGILTNANAAGQVIFLPLLMALVVYSGWRNALMAIVVPAVLLLPAIWLWLRDDPADIGIEPYGTGEKNALRQSRAALPGRDSRHVTASSIGEVFRSPSFWLLSGSFFVCGFTTNGLVGTHLIPHAIEQGMPQVTAAWAVGIMGGASFVGTTFAGWLVDRMDARKVLAVCYVLRGLSLFILTYVVETAGLFAFAVIYGLDWYATGPATTAILAQHYGQEKVGTLFGLVFVSHQLGGALAAVGGGWAHMQFGDYQYAFLTGAFMGLVGAGLSMMIRPAGRTTPSVPVAAIAFGLGHD